MKILCEAVSFGFGPVGKLIAIAELLSKDYELDFIGSGCSFDLAKKSVVFNHFYDIDTTSFNAMIPTDIIDRYDIVISVINPVFGEQILKRGKKLIVIDSLFYMWHTLHPVWRSCDLLIIQSFYKENERLQRESLSNAFIVGPIISNTVKSRLNTSKNRLVMNFGGADYPYLSKSDILPEFIKSIAIQLSSINGFDEKIITIGSRFSKELACLEEYGYIIQTCSHEEFIALIKNANILMSVPGLTSTFEAFSLSIPTLFLPPLNYSQLLNLQKLKNNGVADYSINWYALFDVPDEILEETQGVLLVESFLTKSLINNKMQNTIKNRFETGINNKENLQSLANKQNSFFEKTGGIGTYKAVNQIKTLING